ncbi:hypothetical protein PTKIN_Ptkin02bG0192100 [Pterospermum kingtungense]
MRHGTNAEQHNSVGFAVIIRVLGYGKHCNAPLQCKCALFIVHLVGLPKRQARKRIIGLDWAGLLGYGGLRCHVRRGPEEPESPDLATGFVKTIGSLAVTRLAGE